MPSPINMEIDMHPSISAIIIAKNEQDMIEDALKSLDFVDDIILIDNNSSDDTPKIAKEYGARVFVSDSDRFDALREKGLKKSRSDWVFYLDADERVTQSLKKEIKRVVNVQKYNAYIIKRKNFFLGKRMYDDKVHRLFRRRATKRWTGKVHETPQYQGQTSQLKNYIEHYTHRDITSMLEKTNKWSAIEAKLRFDTNHPPIKVWRIIRISLTEAYQQFFKKKVQRYGTEGWIEGIFQVIDKIIVYIKLWEMQQI